MERDEKIKKIRKFLHKHNVAVVSTLHSEKEGIESAVVSIAETPELEIIFGTSNATRKYKNLQKSGHVAFVIGWSSYTGSLQFEGVAREMDREEINSHVSLLTKKNLMNKVFLQKKNQAWFIVKPRWIRLQENLLKGANMFEIDF